MKERFVRLQLKELRKRPLTEGRVKEALYNAWENGASTALFAPNWARSEIIVGDPLERAYARFVLGGIAFNDYRVLHGRDPTAEEYREVVSGMMEREKEIPFICLRFEVQDIFTSGQSAN